ncbi:MAG: hypothetical protein KKI02_08225, partial [Planctomycetes bacterium]|nr:hypothetical protein [Planctomycetota bacterium]
MTVRAKHFWLIVLGQAVCVAVGLWMHHRLLHSSAYEAVEKAFWSDIEVTAAHLLRGIEAATPAAQSPDVDASEWTQAAVERERPGQCYVTIVDSGWRAVRQFPGVGSEQSEPLTLGQAVSWVPSSGPAAGGGASPRGTLDTPGGPHLAVACSLPQGAGYLLVHRPT